MPSTFCLPLSTILALSFFLAAVPAKASDPCGTHLKTTCNNCHTLDAVCTRLGDPAKEWKETLKRMIMNGAELSRGEVEAMAACMSQPSKAAQTSCGK